MERQPSTGSCYSELPDVVRKGTFVFTSEASLLASSVGLFKNIVGAGVLALPAGVAAVWQSPQALWPSVFLIAAMGILSGYSFWACGRICMSSGATTYAGMLARIYGEKWRKAVDFLIVLKAGAAVVIYELIIGDLAHDVALQLGFAGVFAQRPVLLTIIAVFVLLPLGLRRSFAALAPFAALGIAGVLFTTVFMGLRWAQGAYAPGGEFFADAPFKPVFDEQTMRPYSAFKLISMISSAYICHFNAPKFAHELVNHTPYRLGLLTLVGFGSAFLVMASAMVLGFLTFGGASQGLILNNYASTDKLVVAARVAVLASVTFGFPFTFAACRDGLLEFISAESAETDINAMTTVRFVLTVVLIAGATAIASVLEDLGFVVALSGAVLSSNIVFTLPAIAFLGVCGPKVRAGRASRIERIEYSANKVIAVIGALLSVQGAVVTCIDQANPG